jgi:hypothetical protein
MRDAQGHVSFLMRDASSARSPPRTMRASFIAT